MNYFDLKINLKKDFSKFQKIKLAILADSTSTFLTQAIKGYGYEEKINFEIFEADYNQIDLQILNVSSELYSFKPEVVLIFNSSQKLLNNFYKLKTKEQKEFAVNHLKYVAKLTKVIEKNLTTKVIYFNFPEINDGVYGNFANKLKQSFLRQLRQINVELMDFAQKSNSFSICDLSNLQNQYGVSFLTDEKLYINADMVLSLDSLPCVSKQVVEMIVSSGGKLKKCVILDLDDTLWGGTVGDDGVENIEIGSLGIGKAFSEFQLWLKQLKKRGILLVVCSKNNENTAKEAFSHPEMVLQLEDFALFYANWDTKIENIYKIQKKLNIGFDSMVFLDNNPAERGLVLKQFPEITVPELPEDPACFLTYLRPLNLFETASLSKEDEVRTKKYQEETRRDDFQKLYKTEKEFLESIGMVAKIESFQKFDLPRLVQLSLRSNQFNLRTIRYSLDQMKKIVDSDNFLTSSIKLKDKFGDYGLVSFIILRRENNHLFIENWVMSCRVLKRGVENLVLNHIIHLAKKEGVSKIVGEYIETAKNGLVKDLFAELGFSLENGFWILENDFSPRPTQIKHETKSNISRSGKNISRSL